jgi:copper chaperone CopZ
MLFFPQIRTVLAESRSSAPASPAAPLSGLTESATLAIKGMTCEECAVELRQAFLKLPGVVGAEVEYKTSSARVTFRRGGVTPDQLRQTVANAGYIISSIAMRNG